MDKQYIYESATAQNLDRTVSLLIDNEQKEVNLKDYLKYEKGQYYMCPNVYDKYTAKLNGLPYNNLTMLPNLGLLVVDEIEIDSKTNENLDEQDTLNDQNILDAVYFLIIEKINECNYTKTDLFLSKILTQILEFKNENNSN